MGGGINSIHHAAAIWQWQIPIGYPVGIGIPTGNGLRNTLISWNLAGIWVPQSVLSTCQVDNSTLTGIWQALSIIPNEKRPVGNVASDNVIDRPFFGW